MTSPANLLQPLNGNDLSSMLEEDEKWMRYALLLAERAQSLDEVPVGAVIVQDGELIAEGFNSPINHHDPTAHAEILALRNAAQRLKNYRVTGNTTLYVTLEPCPMCAGAIVHARINRVVFGAFDPRSGSAGSVYSLLDSEKLNHRAEVTGGVLQELCASQLQAFFKIRR